MVNTTSQFVQSLTIAAEAIPEFGQSHRVDIAYHPDSSRSHATLCDPAYSWNAADRQRGKEMLYLVWLDDEKAVWLSPVGRNFCKKFVRSDPRRRGQIKFFLNLPAYGLRD